MEIITGYKGRAHVTAEQDRAVNQGIFGEGSYVLGIGQRMRAEIASNTEIRIYDGVISHQGCTAAIRKNAYDSVQIANGSQGMKRKDLVVARYTRNAGTGVEDLTWNVIQGTPAATNPAVPSETIGDIQAGDTIADMKMFIVTMNGINMESVESVFSIHTFASDAASVAYSGIAEGETVKEAIDNNAKGIAKNENQIITDTVNTGSVNIGANTGTSRSYTVPAHEGYKPIGVIDWYVTGERASQVTFPNVYFQSDGKLNVYFKNTDSGSVALTNASYFTILYVKE